MSQPSSISCVIPVYNEQETLEHCYERVSKMLDALDESPQEIIFVNDGSTDRTDAMLQALVQRDERVVAMRLTRNFGHQAALAAGLRESRGDLVAVLDGDLQDPPEVVPEMIQAIHEGADVAYGVRKHRKEHVLKKIAYASFYRLMRSVSDIDIPLDAGDFCVMHRGVVSRMNELPESHRFIRGLRAWVGGKQVGVPYERHERFAGRSKYSLWKLMGLAAQGLFGFSSTPVKLIQLLGFGTSLISALVALTYLGVYFFAAEPLPAGWTTLVISIWFIAGVQLLSVGLLGEYIHRTFTEVRQRPSAFVAEVLAQSRSSISLPCNTITPPNTQGSIDSTGGGGAERQRLSKPFAA
ncbi:MAG: glycosyltransferase family 2 protein [Planctomycetota bacterium]